MCNYARRQRNENLQRGHELADNDTPLQFTVTRDDLFSFTHGEIFGTMYPSRDKIGLDEWVWRLSKTVINRVRDAAGELLEVKAETVVISEGYASRAADAAYDMRACLHRQIEKAGQSV
ncbi:MAG: hypothetical protein QOC89_3664 [Paraburkholderia sp.]|nr:hypothetical protein [Paraburkholderia sp.]